MALRRMEFFKRARDLGSFTYEKCFWVLFGMDNSSKFQIKIFNFFRILLEKFSEKMNFWTRVLVFRNCLLMIHKIKNYWVFHIYAKESLTILHIGKKSICKFINI